MEIACKTAFYINLKFKLNSSWIAFANLKFINITWKIKQTMHNRFDEFQSSFQFTETACVQFRVAITN